MLTYAQHHVCHVRDSCIDSYFKIDQGSGPFGEPHDHSSRTLNRFWTQPPPCGRDAHSDAQILFYDPFVLKDPISLLWPFLCSGQLRLMERTKYLLTATVLAGLPLLALLWNRQSNSRPPYPPGPRPEPFIAHLRSFPKKRWYETFSEWSKTYGDLICLRVIGKTFVIINGLDEARELLVRRGHIHSGRQQTVMLNDVCVSPLLCLVFELITL
jgi:hypothetical protein